MNYLRFLPMPSTLYSWFHAFRSNITTINVGAKKRTIGNGTCKSFRILGMTLVLFLGGMSVTHAQEIPLTSQELQDFQQKVSVVAQESKTIVNTFKQLKHIDFLANDIESTGALYFKAPNTIKWSYTAPYEYSVIFKNQTLYINDDGKKSDVNLASNKIFKKLNDLIARSVSGDLLDTSQFDITAFRKQGVYTTNLVPKDQALRDMFSTIALTFSKTLLVSQVKLIEPSGDYTLILFKNKALNQPIPDATFAH